jgi:prepilin signal peptidase PulO-like enzyme (type II secretory pathway)
MLSSLITALVGALVFGAAGLGGIAAATALLPRLPRFEDGPPQFDVPPAVLIAGAAVLGAIVGFQDLPIGHLVVAAIVVLCLVAIWYCDARTGIVPDLFTLPPLALLIVYQLLHQNPMVIASAAAVFAPFAILAALSKGQGMGWGDAKLAALGGAFLGLSTAAGAFIIASFVAGVVSWIRFRSRTAKIAFAPYLVAAIAVSLALNLT